MVNPWYGFDIDRHPKVRAAVDAAIRWYNEASENGGCLALAGGYGTGKSHIAKVIYRAWGPTAVFFTEPTLLDALRATYGPGGGDECAVIRRINRAAVLILDDIGVSHVKEDSRSWLQEKYWRLFDGRAEANRATLITTNLGLDDLSEWIGPRAADRLIGMIGRADNYVDLFGVPSYRGDWLETLKK